jgi:hypothetical protein
MNIFRVLRSIILYMSKLSIELTRNDNWMLSSFWGFFLGILAFIVLLEYSNFWGRLLTLFLAYLAGNCLGATAIIIDRIIDEE